MLSVLSLSAGPAASNDRALVLREGDILTQSATEIELTRRSIAVPSSSGLWPDGIVPYRIDSELSTQSVRAINEAINRWNDISAITLQLAETGDTDSILFQPGSGCASWVGRQGGVQEVWAAPTCTVGSMMHEIGHALGLEHEHTRPDRDQYITIHWDNIDPLKHHNFDVAPNGSRMVGDYDYDSIMHYGSMNFSLDGSPTITPILPNAGAIGQRLSPSTGDIAAIDRLYRSDLSLVSNLVTTGAGTEVTLYVSSTQEQGAHDIEVLVGAGEEHALLEYSGKGWSCNTSVKQLAHCSLARLSGSAQSVLRLRVSGNLLEQSMHAALRSKTPDHNLSNNGTGAEFVPELAAASLEDDPLVTTGYGGSASPPLSGYLLLILLYRQTRCWIERQARHRIKRLSV